MHKQITFRNMDHVESIENYANEKLEKVEEFLSHEPTPIFINLVLEPSKVHSHHSVELRVKTPHDHLVSNYEGPNFYQVLDRVIDVMYDELHREKKKRVDKRNHRLKVSQLPEHIEEQEKDEEDNE